MHPELPFLGAGAIALIGGAMREHGWPSNATTSIVGTVALVLVASATANTRIAPLVRAIGLLLLLTSVMAAVNAASKTKKVKNG
jgi:peptidoglycan/LPS O-acetylase OafA/YrhL